jgi:DNA-binding NarL/FixJ family response regulator
MNDTTLKGLVVITDNPMMAGAIRAGLNEGRAFRLLGYLDPRKASARRLTEAGAEVVLVDEADCPDRAIELIRGLREEGGEIAVVLLAMRIDGDLLERALQAGASSVISKAIHPGALATFLDAALSGHIVHSPAQIGAAGEASGPGDSHDTECAEHLPLTPRELGVLRLLAAGASNSDIAGQLWITRQTVKFHLSNIYRKLGVSNRTGACSYAHLNGVMRTAAADNTPVRDAALAAASAS